MPPKKKRGENPESDSDSDSDGADVHQTTRNMVREQENELLKYKTAKVVKEKGEYPEINSLPGRKLVHGGWLDGRVKVFYDDVWMTADEYKKQRENHSRPSLSMMHAGLPKTTSGKKDAQTLVSNLGTRPAQAAKPFSVQVHVPVRHILQATRAAAVSAGETKTAATAFVQSSNPPSENSFVKTPFAGPRPGYTFQTNGKWGDGYYKIISPVPVQSTLRKQGGRRKYKKKRKSKTHYRRKPKRKRKRTKKFRKGSKSKTHRGKNFETRKTSKNYSSKRWKRMTGRRTRKSPLFTFV